jgi:calcineurin-like phosphoesterase family protein
MGQIHYVHTVPNSHSFGSLSNIVMHYSIKPEELTKEYLITGFKNTLKRKYEIQHFGDYCDISPHFNTLQEIINYLEEQPKFVLDNFVKLIKNTLANNMDLKPRFKMERQEVYSRIDTERQYQDLRWSPRREKNETPDESKPPAEWINYMEFHLREAKNAVYFLNEEEALAQVRKVAALAVRCMEIHGCPERVIPEDLFDGE